MADTEKDFQARVVEFATLMGWKVYHTYDSRRSNPGFPDLILVQGRSMFCLELKSEKGKVSDAQMEWIAALDDVRHVEAGVYRPHDEEDIRKALKKRGKW